jgi:hypothetical protein
MVKVVMHKTLQSTIILLVVLSGCASELRRTGIPAWDYERDEVRGNAGAVSGTTILPGLLDILLDRHLIRETVIGGLVDDEINLTPNKLKVAIKTALAESTQVKIQLPTSDSGDSDATQWTVSESYKGQIITDWKPTPGKEKGLFWWKKTYQAEVRHIISIKRSYRSPHHSNFSIFTEVRERPNSNYKWVQGDPELGRASFEDIKYKSTNSVPLALRTKEKPVQDSEEKK